LTWPWVKRKGEKEDGDSSEALAKIVTEAFGKSGKAKFPGIQALDLPEFPSAYKQGALATREALNLLRKESALDWTFLSPSADISPDQRTGKFRLGTDQLLNDASGHSRISTQDYAVAMIDEVEHPAHIRQRFTVGY
jgi:uncharacterized protein